MCEAVTIDALPCQLNRTGGGYFQCECHFVSFSFVLCY